MNDSKGNRSANVGLFLWEKPALYYKGQKRAEAENSVLPGGVEMYIVFLDLSE